MLEICFPLTRRSSYIEDLDPFYTFALTETASTHQVPALREAIAAHLKFENSIALKISVSSFLIGVWSYVDHETTTNVSNRKGILYISSRCTCHSSMYFRVLQRTGRSTWIGWTRLS